MAQNALWSEAFIYDITRLYILRECRMRMALCDLDHSHLQILSNVCAVVIDMRLSCSSACGITCVRAVVSTQLHLGCRSHIHAVYLYDFVSSRLFFWYVPLLLPGFLRRGHTVHALSALPTQIRPGQGCA